MAPVTPSAGVLPGLVLRLGDAVGGGETDRGTYGQ
jgi:hypothetical protein